MKPFLHSVHQEREEHPRPPGVSDHILDTLHPSSENREQDETKSELGSPRMISVNVNALDTSCGPTDADQPYVRPERQNDPGDQHSPSHERLPTIENSGSTEALGSASGEPGINSDGPGVEGEASTRNYVGDGPQLRERDELQLRGKNSIQGGCYLKCQDILLIPF